MFVINYHKELKYIHFTFGITLVMPFFIIIKKLYPIIAIEIITLSKHKLDNIKKTLIMYGLRLKTQHINYINKS